MLSNLTCELENESVNYDINNMEYGILLRTLLKILDKYAPMKKKYLRANHATFMAKEVRKVIMIKSKLRNKFLKDKNEQSKHDYRKQHNLCAALVRRAKQQYFSSSDLTLIADYKKFRKTVKLLFSDKTSHKDIISLTEDGKTIPEDLPIAEIFNNHFSNVIRSSCDRNVPTESVIACSQSTASTAINNFRNHPSILSTNKNMERIG